MTSAIDPTKPTAGVAYTADVRQNFANAKSEIEALQAIVVSGGAPLYEAFTATSGQTLFFLAFSYTTGSNYLQVFKNGVHLAQTDFTETSTTSFTLVVGAALNDVIEVYVFGGAGATGATGATGAAGAAATIAVGTVTTGAPGSSATVTNSGSSSAATFDFSIPVGATGATGSIGPTGAAGSAATIAVGTVTTGAPGSSVIVTNSGSSSAATFDFTIPQGAAGTGSGTVTSVGLSLPADYTVTNSPVTATGTLTAVRASQTANYFLASPDGAAGAPTYRAMVVADVPTLNQNTSGTAAGLSATLAASSGGTGVANNVASTITITGSYASTFIFSGAYSYTYPGLTTTLAGLGAVQSWTKAQIGTPVALSVASNAVAVDLSLANNFTLALQATTSQVLSNPTNAVAGQSGSIYITQNATPSTLTFGSNWYEETTGTAPSVSTTASAQNSLHYEVFDSTHVYYVLNKHGVA